MQDKLSLLPFLFTKYTFHLLFPLIHPTLKTPLLLCWIVYGTAYSTQSERLFYVCWVVVGHGRSRRGYLAFTALADIFEFFFYCCAISLLVDLGKDPKHVELVSFS